MILIRLHLTASPTNDPERQLSYGWNQGDSIRSLEMAIGKLQETVEAMKRQEAPDATKAAKPLSFEK